VQSQTTAEHDFLHVQSVHGRHAGVFASLNSEKI